jgi:predicted dienelactone hydrolase
MGLLACSPSPPSPLGSVGVGYTALEFVDPQRSRILETTLWYPASQTSAPVERVYPSGFRGYAEPDAEVLVAAGPRPMVLLSHGDRGQSTNLAWLAEALAEQGYWVAGVDHWLNTTLNNEPKETLRLWNRPLDIRFVLTRLLADPVWGPRIDPRRIGVAGHSSGGYTAFALSGAIFEPERMAAYCQSDSRGPDCDLTSEADAAQVDFAQASKSYRDERIRASFAMAPAVGAGIQVSSLARITTPVHVVTTRNDELLDPTRNAMHYARHTPGAVLTIREQGGHFVYLSRCSSLSVVFTYFLEFDICGTRSPVDRGLAHQEIAELAVEFFDQNLRP